MCVLLRTQINKNGFSRQLNSKSLKSILNGTEETQLAHISPSKSLRHHHFEYRHHFATGIVCTGMVETKMEEAGWFCMAINHDVHSGEKSLCSVYNTPCNPFSELIIPN